MSYLNPISSIASALPPSKLRDIVEPIYIINWWYVAAFVIGSFVCIFIIDRIIRKWKRRVRRERETKRVVVPPYEEAMEQLTAVKPLMKESNDKAFSIAVSQVLRRYIERQFEIRAKEMTTEEFLPIAIDHGALKGDLSEILTDFLSHVDLVKFAKHKLDEGSMTELYESAERFIRESYTKSIITEEPVEE